LTGFGNVRRFSLRLFDAARKLAGGFPLHSECVWPGRRTDLLVAHESIYHFFAQRATGKRVLDAGSGAGYGSALLRELGAASVLGIDIDARYVTYARRNYGGANVEFAVGNCEALELAPASFDLVVSSNMLEHLRAPSSFLRAGRAALQEGGEAVLAVPWIVDETTRAQSRRNEFHHSNFTVEEWTHLFDSEGWRSQIWLQTFDPVYGTPDFYDLEVTQRNISAFSFLETELSDVRRPCTIGVVFRLLPAA
jgi:SAM-dependent methyltransferase